MSEELDVLVIGAGQAGLAMGFHLRNLPFKVRLFDEHARVGDAWRERYDSLRLFSPRAYNSLPGLPLAGDPEGYPTKDEVADYLEHYAAIHELPVWLREGVARLSLRDGMFLARTSKARMVSALTVVVAAGAFQLPIVPEYATRLDARVQQFTARSYRHPRQICTGRVLVVGDGATGRQVARELLASHEVWLSTGKARLIIPQRVLGRDTLWWSERLGLLRADRDSWVGRMVRSRDAVPGSELRSSALERAGVRLLPRTVAAEGNRVHFSDQRSEEFDAVIWAMGHRDEVSWLDIPGACDSAGHVRERRGVSPVPGLFYLGREWQNNRASSLLYGAGADAAELLHSSLLPYLREQPGRRTPANGRTRCVTV